MPGGHVLQKPALGVGQTGNKLHAKKSYESHTWALKLLWIPHMSLEIVMNPTHEPWNGTKSLVWPQQGNKDLKCGMCNGETADSRS